MEKLVDFYSQVLKSASLHADENGYIHIGEESGEVLHVGENVLVLPTRSQLRDPTGAKVFFHPLSENALAKISDPLVSLVYHMNGSLSITFAELLHELKSFACSPSNSVRLVNNPAQLEILKNVDGTQSSSDSDKDFVNFIMKQIKENPSSAFIKIQLGRAGTYKGREMRRVGYVTFPLYRELKADLELPRKDSKFSISKNHINMIVKIYEAVFPGLDQPEAYNYGLETGVFPFFTTLLESFKKVAIPLNRVISVFQDDFAGEVSQIPLEWDEAFSDKEQLSVLSKMVGPLGGNQPVETRMNEPSHVTVEASKPKVAGSVTHQVASLAPEVRSPDQVQKKAGSSSSGTMELSEWFQTRGTQSAMGMAGVALGTIKQHNDAYVAFYQKLMQGTGGVPHPQFPPPHLIPPGGMAPPFPGSPIPQYNIQLQAPQPMQAGYPMPGYGQQVPVDAWGKPIQQAPAPWQAAPGWGAPPAPQSGWGVAPTQGGWTNQAPGWGVAAPQQNGWGVAPQQNAWGQPQQQSSWNGVVLPGCV